MNYIFGRKPVLESLRAGENILEIIILDTATGSPEISNILSLSKKIKVTTKNSGFFKGYGQHNHQGVIAILQDFEFKYRDIDDIFSQAERKGEKPLIAILDEITDPHNLGAIIRSAECAGFHGVIIPKHRSAEVNATVVKTSAGSVVHIPIVQVTNLTHVFEEIQERGVWIYGTDMDTEKNYTQIDSKDAIAVVIGSEGSGLRKMIKEHCDFLIKIPMHGKIESLNASVAAGIVFFDIVRQRAIKKP